jgi:mannose-6-phosphate isomerase-like protein (cupin superfamily)
MKAQTRKMQGGQEYESGERCFITEVSNDHGDEQVSIARARVPPGVTTCWHRLHGIAERYIIASGQGWVEIEGLEPGEVIEGDVVRIPPGYRQRITNTGTPDLIIYCVCTPPYEERFYELLEPGSEKLPG